MRKLTPLVMLTIAAALCACGGGGGGLTQTTLLDTDPQIRSDAYGETAIPLVADLAATTRVTDEVSTYTFVAGDLVESEGAVMNGANLELNSTGLSWAVLGITLDSGQLPAALHLSGTSNGVYVGVGEFADNCWQWLGGAYTANAEIAVPSGSTSSSHDFFVALVCADGCQANLEVSLELEDVEGTWNFMVWMAGDNNLAANAFYDIQELESIGSSANLNILVGYDINPTYLGPGHVGANNVNFIRVVQDSYERVINTTGDEANQSFSRTGYNSADPANVLAFVEWCEANFPAEHSMLVLWDHGDGWLASDGTAGAGGGSARGASAILSDYTDGNYEMTNNDAIAAALSDYHFDVLAFDACNMAQLEALYEYRGLADLLVASEGLVPGDGFDYSGALGTWTGSWPLTARQISDTFVDSFIDCYENEEYCTLGVFDAASVGTLTQRLGTLAGLVTTNSATESEPLMGSIDLAWEIADEDGPSGDGARDLQEFLEFYRDNTSASSIKTAINSALSAWNSAVLYYDQYDMPRTTGLAVYLPDSDFFTQDYRDRYELTTFDADTGWLAMLEATGVPEGDYPSGDWSAGDQIEISWSNTDADFDLEIWDPEFNYGSPYEPEELAGLIQFSQDSYDSGQARESGKLLPAAYHGTYYIDIDFVDYDGTPPASINVTVKLYDSGGSLKSDLGTVAFSAGDLGSTREAVILTY
ncbi:hypothetical protein JW859_01630 [bacterium]|nr:hypothetical protein [bacterium]